MGFSGRDSHSESLPPDIVGVASSSPLPQTFDYESGPRSYALTIQARDQLTPEMTGTANLTVTILDVNDHPPSFSSSSYTFSVCPHTIYLFVS